MNEIGRGWLFVVLAAMALTLAALSYFLFGKDAPPPATSRPREPAPVEAAEVKLPEPSPPPIAADETDLCGYGRVKKAAAAEILAQARIAADKVFDRLKDRLAASREPREQALGLYLKGSTDTLVALASGSGDPQVYGLAFVACAYGGYGPSCDLLSAQQWAMIEPDNAVPWLLIAARQPPVDEATFDQAIYRASTAQRSDPHLPNLLGLAQMPEIRGQPPQTRSLLEDDLVAMQATLPTLSYQPFFRYCNFPSVAEAGHLIACNDLATLFIERDNSMIGLGVGIKLAQTADWPPDRIDKLLKTKAQYQAALTAAMTQHPDRARTDCEEQADFEHWAADNARLGDRGAAMKFVQEAGSGATQLTPR